MELPKLRRVAHQMSAGALHRRQTQQVHNSHLSCRAIRLKRSQCAGHQQSMGNGHTKVEKDKQMAQMSIYSCIRATRKWMAAPSCTMERTLDITRVAFDTNGGIIKLPSGTRITNKGTAISCILCGEVLFEGPRQIWEEQAVLDVARMAQACNHRCAAGLP